MFGKHRKKHHADHVDPDLPITPMLDMTFQLLSFFVFTFQPQSREAQIAFTLPEEKGGAAGIPDPTSDEMKPVVLVVEVRTTEDGKIRTMALRIEDKNVQAGGRPAKTEIGPSPEAYKQVIAGKFSEYTSQKRGVKLQLEIGDDLGWAYAVHLIDIAKGIGFTDVAPTLLPKGSD
ncbi:MAG TPA: biopolymer transporter ExbD [Gemmataceae bacterium]|nr:biopolymer transporter ExbD [Gemmataceae bacterium]